MTTTTGAPAALYRRYRPARFADLVGQEPAASALTFALGAGRVAHAYLFSGPRGTGKTTTARILAMALNCTQPDGVEPCGSCDSCTSIRSGSSVDVIELDAASNNGVDHMREIVAKAALCSPGNRKVYILDEVHVLSSAASNALLKTLEEPPAHVVFILATTDPQKLLPTVRSRALHLAFTLVSPPVLTEHLRHVIADAGLEVSEAALADVVRQAKGSVRDALSHLDVASASGTLERPDHSSALLDGLIDTDVAAVFRAVAEAAKLGVEPRTLAESALEALREMFLVQMGAPDLVAYPDTTALTARSMRAGPRATVRMIDALGDAVLAMQAGHDPRINLEVCTARYCRTPAATAAA